MPSANSPASFTTAASPPEFVGSTEGLLQTMPWGVLLLASDGRVTVLNPQAEALWGVPAAAVLGRQPAEVQPVVLPAELVQALLAPPAMPAPDGSSAEHWLPHTKQWITQRTAPASDGHMWVYWDNVTLRHQAEQTTRQHHAAQQQTSQLLLAVEDVARTGSYEADLATMSFHFSDGLFRLFGEAPQSFVPTLEFIDARSHPDDVPVVKAVLDQAVLDKQPYHYVRRIHRTDGQLRILEAHGHVICDASGGAVKLLGLVQDITERRQAEEEVLRVQQELARRATNRYRTLFQALDQGYFLVEIEFDAQNQPIDILYLEANPAAVRMVGKDFTGQRLRDINPTYEPYWYEIFGRVARTGAGERLERYAEPDQKWYNFYVFKIGDAASRQVAVVFEDVTERRQVEQDLRDSEARQLYLLALSDALHPVADAVAIQATVTDTAMHYFQADRCYYGEIDGDTVTIRRDAARPGLPSVAAVYALSTMPVFNAMLRGSRPVVVADVRTSEVMDDNLRQLCLGFGILAYINVPITKNGQRVGMLCLTQTTPREWTALEISLVQETAERTWAAVERARAEVALRESEEKYRAIFHSINEGFSLLDIQFNEQGEAEDAIIRDANPAQDRIDGMRASIGKRVREILPDIEMRWIQRNAHVALSGEPAHFEDWSDATQRWYEVDASRVGGDGSTLVAIVYNDISERKRREANAAFLAIVQDDLSRLATPDEILHVVGAKLGDYLQLNACYFCTIDEAQDHNLTMRHAWNRPGTVVPPGSFRMQDFWSEDIIRASRAGETIIVRDTKTDKRLADEAYVAHGVRAWVGVPFHRRGQWTNLVTVSGPEPRNWQPHETELLGEVVQRLAPRLERARAEEALRQSEERQAFLVRLGDALRPLAEPEAIQREASRMLRAQLGAGQIVYTEAANPHELHAVATDAADGIPNQLGFHYHKADFGPAMWAELETGRTHWRDDVAADPNFSDQEKAVYLSLHAPAWANVPLVKNGQLVVMLTAHFPVPHRWTPDELHLLEETAERTWAAAERARAEQALRESEALLQKAFSIDTVGLLFFTLDGRMTATNEAFVRMSGYSREALPAMSWKALTAPEFWDVTTHAASELADQGETAPYEKQFVRPDGSSWWGLCAPTRVRGHGATAECVEFIVDIGERKRAEEQLRTFSASLEQQVAERTQALQASQQLLSAIFEAVPLQLGYYEAVRDDQGQLVDLRAVAVNHAAVDKMGLPDAPGQLMSSQLPGLREQPIWHALAHVINTGQPQRQELRHGFGPATVWFDVLYTRLNDGIILASLDITARKQAEQELRESQALLQSAFDTSLISMSVLHAVRLETGVVQDFRIAAVNKELEKETGRTDLVGKLYAQEFPGIRQAGLFDLMLQVMETGEPAGKEYHYPHEGFSKWYTCQFVKLDGGVVATNLDITERKLAEEKIREQAHFIARVNETLPDLMTVTDLPSGQVLYVNRNPDEAPGFEREKLLNVPFKEQTSLLHMHPDDAALLPDYFTRAATLADHEIAAYCYRAKLNTNHWRSFQVRGSVFQRDPTTGAVTQVLSVAQDVTDRKEAELQQAKSYQLLQQSEEVAGLGSWDYDRTTGEFQWSEGMYRLFGLPLGSSIRPETYLDFAVADDLPVAERIVRGLAEGRAGFEETLRIQVGEAVKTMRVKAAVVLDQAGEPQRVLGVDFDISDVQRLEAENLQMRLTQQQALINAVLEAQETERQRMAESLHNGVGQTLYAAKLQLDQLRTAAAPAAWGRVDALLVDAIRQTRSLSHELVPTVLNEFGLAAALHGICRKLSGPRLRFQCTVETEDQPLPQPLQVAVYRMAQELAQNVVKHAHGATEASLELETMPGFVLLRAEDNGAGFATDPQFATGLGLRTIRDRVALLGGSMDVGSSPGSGTYVRLRIPLPAFPSPDEAPVSRA